jgi:hypothetical protein
MLILVLPAAAAEVTRIPSKRASLIDCEPQKPGLTLAVNPLLCKTRTISSEHTTRYVSTVSLADASSLSRSYGRVHGNTANIAVAYCA